MKQPSPYRVSHLDALEAESIFVMREVMAEFERPVMLFSGGKDSIVMLRLAEKAFTPARIPFPVMHIDTGHNFPEVLEYRDSRVAEMGLHLVVASVQEAINTGLVRELPDGTRNRIQTPVLLAAVEKYRFDALFGGARRDEEKARAKERMFSFRDDFGRTVSDASQTAAVLSDADTVEKVIDEVAATRVTERGATRGDDRVSEAAMEDRKREGYF
ncbi:3'-phosphoadenosine 5'-phosphosulfate sulfotransferase (PAPS reductase)/FAD synthetase [Actinoplanes tereljensis]|uniref:Phosphoadenosine phosphosulphate reductase domain-containing protein n=1 Tax=Paractinoplanes tereljensis TaxID=571912 RepID=A0A919NY98_9ACTN|nr:sulfate adenylyltransferase subunit CysD [Actinoplanes tereljensis]GIF26156.1 hypothetical protein Ate02nite_88860 [Actinoplanes tereljensis]